MQWGGQMKNKVEELRKNIGFNQDDLAKALKVSRQTIGSKAILSGKTEVSDYISYCNRLSQIVFQAVIQLAGNKNQHYR